MTPQVPPAVIRVAIADDQMLVRAGFAALLAAEDDMEVAGEAADGAEAVRLAHREKPDVLLMDIRMPGMDGIEATRRIAASPDLAGVHVVILTTFELDEYIFDGLRAGAAGTPREREVVSLVADGLTNADIAGRWHVSESTVKTHVNRAMMKLAARDRAQLVVLAYQSGLARAGW